jgi:hypothetical protein
VRRRDRQHATKPTTPIPQRDKTRELGSGTITPGTLAPVAVPKENVADVTVVSAVIPAPVIVNVADPNRKGL